MQSERLSTFVSDLNYGDLSPEVIDKTKQCVADLLGVALAGSQDPTGHIWRDYFRKDGGTPLAAVLSPGFPSLNYKCAAMLNAAWTHLLDMDDVHNASITHLGAVTIPAALAVGQVRACSGRDVLTAIVAGYEVGARVGEAVVPDSYYYWHTTGIAGTFSSASAAGKLMNLSADQMVHALGSAGTQSTGLWEFLESGAMSKSLHTANATLCGIRSAELAALGFTGAPQMLEGERGLLRAIAGGGHPEALTSGLGEGAYRISGNSFKAYPCCRHIHSAIYAAERLAPRLVGRLQDVAEIIDRTYPTALGVTDRPTPSGSYAHRFSAQYCIAAALLTGKLEEADFGQDAASSPDRRALMAKVRMVADPDIAALNCTDQDQWPHRLEVLLRDGTVLSEYVVYPPGDFNRPFTWDDLAAKFFRLTEGVLPRKQALCLLTRIRSLDRLEDINGLFAPLTEENGVLL